MTIQLQVKQSQQDYIFPVLSGFFLQACIVRSHVCTLMNTLLEVKRKQNIPSNDTLALVLASPPELRTTHSYSPQFRFIASLRTSFAVRPSNVVFACQEPTSLPSLYHVARPSMASE